MLYAGLGIVSEVTLYATKERPCPGWPESAISGITKSLLEAAIRHLAVGILNVAACELDAG